MKAVLAVILVVLLGLAGFGNLGSAQAEGHSVLLAEEKQRIMQATVRINFANGEVGVNWALGSMVLLDGKTVVVTHNHWASSLAESSTIILSAADHALIATLTGKEFFASIRYQDAGTILFDAPQAMLNYVRAAHIELPAAAVGQDLAPGSLVWSVYFPGKVGEELDVRAMSVENGNAAQQQPVYRLRSLDGRPEQPGDSGSGIWWDGKLVGNMWAIVMVATPAGGWQDSNESYAAVLNW